MSSPRGRESRRVRSSRKSASTFFRGWTRLRGTAKPASAQRPVLYRPHLFNSFRCEVEEEDHVADRASAQTLQEQDISSSMESFVSTSLEGAHGTIEVSPPSMRCISSTRGPPICALRPRDWGIIFYIRINLGGSFHTYPDVGGPFQSLQEAKNAIDRYLHDLRDPKMCLRGLSLVEMGVQQCLYWPDGTWKKQPIDKIRDWTHHLVQALVDKYNDDHNLLGDHAYELQEVVGFQPICEVDIFSYYYHINFTGKTKGDDCFVLFFAEVISTKAEHEELVLSCFCVLKPTDGGLCYGCRNNGSGSMKHPDDAAAYTGGHVKDAFLPFGASNKTKWIEYRADQEFQAAEEARIRRHYMGLDDPAVLDRLRLLPLGAGPLDKAKVQEWMAMGAD